MKKYRMDTTALVFFIFILVLGLYDLAVVVFSGTSSSVSNFLTNIGLTSPLFSFVLGCIAGHAIFPMKEKGTKVYADANRAIYKDADKILLDWHEMRALSDTHEATLIDVRKL